MLTDPHDALQSRCVLPSVVIVTTSQPCVSLGGGLNCQTTCTLLTYQGLVPSVPVIRGVTETEPIWTCPPAPAGTARQAKAKKRSNNQRFAVVTLGTPPPRPVPRN